MTCVIGLVHDGIVWMGADSAGVDVGSLSLQNRSDPKVFKNDKFVMGFTSSFRMGSLLRYSFTPPEQANSIDDDKYMNTWFINAVRECLKNGGWARKEHEWEIGGDFLVGYKGRLYGVEGDYQVSTVAESFMAIGCGNQIAIGAMYAAKALPPQKRIRLALEAAERFSAGVRGPFSIIKG